MGNSLSSLNSSTNNSQPHSPNEHLSIGERFSDLFIGSYAAHTLRDSATINQSPPSLAAAAAIAARQRLIEELDYLAQQRTTDDHMPSSHHQEPRLVSNDRSRHDSSRGGEEEIDNNSSSSNEDGGGDDDDNSSSSNPFSLFHRIRRAFLRRELDVRHNFNMLSDHSEDEEELIQRRECAKKQCEAPCYITIPDPENSEPHTSYKRLRHDIIANSGLAFDIQPKSSIIIDSSTNPPIETVTEETLFQPSCSSFRSIVRNAKFGVGPPRINHSVVAPPTRCFINAIDKSQLAAYRNRITPNRRKIIDKTQTKTFCAHYIRDGEGLLTASQDHNIRIYQRQTARQRYVKTCTIEVPFVGWSILDVAVSPNGRHVIYSTWNNVLYQFDLENEDGGWNDMPFEMDDSRFAIFSIKFNSLGTEVMAGTTAGIYIYNREIDRCVMKVEGHEDDINAVCFANADSNLILSSGDDGLVKLWDRRTMGFEGDGKPVAIFAGHRDGITYIDSRGDDRYFLTNSKDQSIKVWDLRVHSNDAAIESTRRSVKGQKWDYRWQYLPASAIKTTNLPGDSSVMTIRGHSVLHTLIRSRFSPQHTGKRFIYTGCARGSCMVYDLYTGELHKKYKGHKAVVRDCQWHPYDNEIITSSWDGNVYVWRYDERGPKQKYLDADSQVVQAYDSTDEWDEPLPKTMQEREKRAKERNSQFNPATVWRGLPSNATTRAAQIKYAQTDPDIPSASSDEEETYATAAKRARRPLRRSGS